MTDRRQTRTWSGPALERVIISPGRGNLVSLVFEGASRGPALPGLGRGRRFFYPVKQSDPRWKSLSETAKRALEAVFVPGVDAVTLRPYSAQAERNPVISFANVAQAMKRAFIEQALVAEAGVEIRVPLDTMELGTGLVIVIASADGSVPAELAGLPTWPAGNEMPFGCSGQTTQVCIVPNAGEAGQLARLIERLMHDPDLRRRVYAMLGRH